MKLKYFILFGLLAITLLMPATFAWWNTNYQYRKPITITEQSGSDLTNYQVKLTIDTATLISAGKMNSDCSDMRFVDSDDSTSLSYWIEGGCNSANTIVWVKIPSLTASSSKTIYMYYDNPSATSASNIDNTFIFGDDFSGSSLDTNKWTGDTSSATLSNGIMTLTTDGGDVFIFGKNNYLYKRIKFKISYNSYNSAQQDKHDSEGGFRTNSAWTNDVRITSYDTNYYQYESRKDGTETLKFSNIEVDNGWHIQEMIWKSDEALFYIDNNQLGTVTNNIPTTAIPPYFRAYASSGYTTKTLVDWVFVSEYVSPEPSYSMGNEEINNAISISSISLTPNPIYTNNDASCQAQFSDTADSATLKWYVNGAEITSVEQSCTNCDSISGTLPSDNFVKGDAIKCEVTATKDANSDTADVSEIVSNSPPTAPSLSYSPTTIYVGDTITATASGSTDADDDTITYYYQFLDGTNVLQDWSTTNTYAVPQSEAHSTITIKAKAYDGTDYSDEATQNVQVENSVPTDPSLSLSPSTIYVGDTLTATASGSTDADGDTITYQYKFYNVNDSTILQDWSTTNTYAVQQSDAHDIIRAYARAYDGYGYSNEVSQDESVSNSAPTISDLSYSPSSVYVGTEITASSTCSDADGDSTTTYYKFYDINDSAVLQDYSTDNTYVVPVSMAHKSIRIYAYCSDGTDSSSEISTDLSVLNSVPTAPTDITWNPNTPAINIEETTTATGSTDTDNDNVTYYYKFYDVNDSTILQDWSTTNTYTPDSSMEGKTLRVYTKAYDGTDYSSEYYEEKTVLGELITITIHSPSSTTYYTDVIPFNVSISSVYNFTAQYYIDGNLTLESANESVYFTRTLGGGSHTFVVNVTDTEGHHNSDNVAFTLNLNVKIQCYDEETLLPIQCYATIHNDTYEDTEWLEESFSGSVTAYGSTLVSKKFNLTGIYSKFSTRSYFTKNDDDLYTFVAITLNGNTIFESFYRASSPDSYGNGFWYNDQKFEFMIYNNVFYLYHNGNLHSATQITSSNPDIELEIMARGYDNTIGYHCGISASGKKSGGSYSWTNVKGEKYVSAYSNIYVSSTGQTFYYPSRGYYEQSELANANIYLLPSAKVTYASLVVKDTDGNALSNRIIRFSKIIGNQKIKLFEGKTDDAGQVTIPVDSNSLYYIEDIQSGEKRQVRFLTNSPYYFTIGLLNLTTPDYFDYYNGFSFSCNDDNNTVTCQVIDKNNTINTFTLTVKKMNLSDMSENVICQNSTNSDYGNLTCNISENCTYELTALTRDGGEILLTQSNVETTANVDSTNSKDMQMLAVLIIGVMLMVATISPVIGILGSVALIVLFSMIGWLHFTGQLIFVVLLGIVIIWKVGGFGG